MIRPALFLLLLIPGSVILSTAQNLNRQPFPEMEKNSQRRIITVPDIDGFITVKGDFHMHTVFSDGAVWPETRVDEAWTDGLDIIAVTDHDRYHPNREYLVFDNSTAFNLSTGAAREKNMLLVRAVELTRKMPPGHFNALFVTDENLPELNDTSRQAFLTAVEKLHNQGAVIVWNHPGWIAQQKDTVKWFDVHQLLLEKGWLNGVEVFNYNEWYPVALQWAMTKNLAPFANSDVHGPMTSTYDYADGFIRPMTLVFAREMTVNSVREAMLERRTVAWFNGHLAGSAALLGKLAAGSLRFEKLDTAGGKARYLVSNHTDLPFRIQGLNKEWNKKLELGPRSEAIITVPGRVGLLRLEFTNWHTGMTENLVWEARLD
jgi:predicted metal-dependent phosphoesterase TrpH